jgi:hypothetical protein
MLDRTHTSKPLVVERPPELKESGRDLRIDACRGIALWCIFLDHVPNNIGSWLTLRNYGFSDAKCSCSSRVTCASPTEARQHEAGAADQPSLGEGVTYMPPSAAHARLRHHGLPAPRISCRREQYAHR